MAGSVSDLSQDVRVAVAMTGGVSLAVWMGGIAREINLLQQASNLRPRATAMTGPTALPSSGAQDPANTSLDLRTRDLYLRLLDVLDVTVTVDVLSGTSAGGINAAMLGLSSAAGADLAGLRDLWLTAGSLDVMLRDPGEKNPSALMQGDKVLYMQLARGIEKFYRERDSAPRPPDGVDTTVYITTTLLAGETSRFTDDYGTLVADVDHHGLFTFTQDALTPPDGEGDSLTALALAARSSASFPAAFEPSFVPFNEQIPAESGIPLRPDMAQYANITRSHWAADGGILANRPLAPLMGAIFARPASPEGREVRRVLAYVVPDGGGTANPQDVPDKAKWSNAPTMIAALKADLSAQLSQSIASDLEAIRKHNDQIRTDHDLRRTLAEIGVRLPDHRLVTPRVFHDFERQQGKGLAEPLVDELMRKLSTIDLPERWAAEFAPGRRSTEARIADEMMAVLGRGWRDGPTDDGAPPVAQGDGLTDQIPESQIHIYAARFGLPAFHAARSTAVRMVKWAYQQAVDPDQRQEIAELRARLEDAFAPPETWNAQQDRIRSLVDASIRSAQGTADATLLQLAHDLADTRRAELLIGVSSTSTLATGWLRVATVVADLVAALRNTTSTTARPSRLDVRNTLQPYLDYFNGSAEPSRVCDRLLNLVIAERALHPAEPKVDQPVEFIQVSANTRTLLAPTEQSVPPSQQLDCVDKLRGVEFHHFAAFYKSSWRAWDWMWGRLDGAGWLVHILLDPRRILAVVENDPDMAPHGCRAKQFANRLRAELGLPAGLPGDCLEDDLAFLDLSGAQLPDSLPNSALFLAQAWQGLIVAHELPVVAERILADSGRLPPLTDPDIHTPAKAGRTSSAVARVRNIWYRIARKQRQGRRQTEPPNLWATKILKLSHDSAVPVETYAHELLDCPVRWETLASQMHSAPFARTATKATAVSTAALSAAPETPTTLRSTLAGARSVTRTGYLATKATGGSGWKTLLVGVVLTVVGIVLATQGVVVVGLTGTITALVGLYLIALGAWGIHRGLLGAVIAITAFAAVGSLALAWVRRGLWGSNATNGVVPEHVLPWLRDSWWGGLAIVGGLLAIAVLINLVTRRRPTSQPGSKRLVRTVSSPAADQPDESHATTGPDA